MAWKSWKGAITIQDPLTGKDKVLEHTEEYFVANPVLQVQSASVSALYLNCGNFLNINCPALGTEYKPTFRATGATATNGAKKGEVTIVPNAPKVVITVSSGGTKIDALKFIKDILYKKINPKLLAVSNNFKFGKARKGDVNAYKALMDSAYGTAKDTVDINSTENKSIDFKQLISGIKAKQ